MQLSTKGEYGLLALVDLAMHGNGEPVQVAHVAQRQGIPKQYLDQLLVTMKRGGLVSSVRGRQGGYRLARSADKITLLDAIRVLEGPVVNQNFGGTRRKLPCRAQLKAIWEALTARIADDLRGKTLQDIATDCKKAEDAMMYYI